MSFDTTDIYGPADLLSGCCGAVAIGEVVDGVGLCSKCREHAGFEREEPAHITPEPSEAKIEALKKSWAEQEVWEKEAEESA